MDAALSFPPGVGWAKDAYEAVTGKSLLTDERLSNGDRTFAIIGADRKVRIPIHRHGTVEASIESLVTRAGGHRLVAWTEAVILVPSDWNHS